MEPLISCRNISILYIGISSFQSTLELISRFEIFQLDLEFLISRYLNKMSSFVY